MASINVLVEGGKATAAPPLGPSVAPLKINVQAVVDKINEKTAEMKGMQVPVTVTVDTDTKEFEISVGTPPVSALVKKELGIDKGAKEAGKARVGDLSMDQAKKVARTKFGSDDEGLVSQVRGTARSMGVTVGEGAVTEEEKKKYEELQKQKEEEAAAKQAEKEEKPETEANKEEKPAEKPEEKK